MLWAGVANNASMACSLRGFQRAGKRVDLKEKKEYGLTQKTGGRGRRSYLGDIQIVGGNNGVFVSFSIHHTLYESDSTAESGIFFSTALREKRKGSQFSVRTFLLYMIASYTSCVVGG